MYFSSGLGVPQDLELVHRVRYGLGNYYEQRTILLSLLTFVEKFGANVNVVERKLADLDSDFKRSQELYRNQEWEASAEIIDGLKSSLRDLDDEAIGLKDRALMWIYIIEWFTVTATLFISGFLLWTLMVRKRLYGEVGVTRLT